MTVLNKTINEFWDQHGIPGLMDFIRIPSKSTDFDPNWESNGFLKQACESAALWLKGIIPDARCELLTETGRTPCLFVEIPPTKGYENSAAMAFYGHFDKLPETGEWQEGLGAWTPVLKNNCLYGRGSADDGYSFYLMGVCVAALKTLNHAHPRIIGIFETQEESGSKDLPYYLNLIHDRLGSVNAFFILDNSCSDYERLWTVSSLRGVIKGTLKVKVLSHGVHSGAYSGIVPDAYGIAQHLLSRVYDPLTSEVKIPSCLAKIPDTCQQQLQNVGNILGDQIWNRAPLLPGVSPISTQPDELLLQNTWKPALTITGISGIPVPENAGNIIHGDVALTLSMRVPPLIDLKQAVNDLNQLLTTDIPFGCEVSLTSISAEPGWASFHTDSKIQELLSKASECHFGKPLATTGQGGSIPIVNEFEKHLPNTALVVTGALGTDSNAHAPNEFLNMNYAKKLTAVIAQVICDFTDQ